MFASAKDPEENIVVSVDMASLSSTVTSLTRTVSVVGGTPDSNPSAILSGAASVVGTVVSQRIIGGVDGTTYKIRYVFTGTDGVTRLVHNEELRVVST